MDESVTRTEASDAVSDLGWRYVLGTLCTFVPVSSSTQAAEAARTIVHATGDDADGHLRLDLRRDTVVVTLHSSATASVTSRDVDIAGRITAAVRDGGLSTTAGIAAGGRSVQLLEIAIDALEIAAVRPFWKAVLGYADESGRSGPQDALVDPLGQGPAIWFQQLDAPRPQRNRIHLDVSVPHDEASGRIQAALDAGGVLVSDSDAPAFWVLADAEGNEACVTTWQGRD